MLSPPSSDTIVADMPPTAKSNCQLVSTKKDGSERLNFTAFHEALLEANGVSLGNGHGSDPGKRGRALSYLLQGAVQRQPAGGQGLHPHARASTRR